MSSGAWHPQGVPLRWTEPHWRLSELSGRAYPGRSLLCKGCGSLFCTEPGDRKGRHYARSSDRAARSSVVAGTSPARPLLRAKKASHPMDAFFCMTGASPVTTRDDQRRSQRRRVVAPLAGAMPAILRSAQNNELHPSAKHLLTHLHQLVYTPVVRKSIPSPIAQR